MRECHLNTGIRALLVYLVVVPVHLLPVLSGCTRPYSVPVKYYGGEYEFLAEHELKAADRWGGESDRPLHQLHAATALMAKGDAEAARRLYSQACAAMLSFDPKNEWKAVTIKESAKDYRGDPYEQLIAYLMLGLLNYREGNLENAQANFKTALLADTGSSDERYRSDSAIAYLFLGKALQRLDDMDTGSDAIGRAGRVPWSKWAVAVVGTALNAAARQAIVETGMTQNDRQWAAELRVAMKCLFDAIATAASTEKTPTDVFLAVRRYAVARLAEMTTSTDRQVRMQLEGQNPARVEAWLQLVCDRAFDGPVTVLGQYQIVVPRHHPRTVVGYASQSEPAVVRADSLKQRKAHFAEEAMIERLASAENNLTVIAYMGPGPSKYAVGQYHQILKYCRNAIPVASCSIRYEGEGQHAELPCLQLEDVGFQAITRGGRQIDAMLKGKALFKDAMISTGTVTLFAASTAMMTAALSASMATAGTAAAGGASAGGAAAGTAAAGSAAAPTIAFPPAFLVVIGALLVITAVSFLVAIATNPAADTRHWQTIPGAFYVGAGHVPSGAYTLTVECPTTHTFTLADLIKCHENPAEKHPAYKGPALGAHYGGEARDIEVRPGFETVVIMNVGPFLDNGAGPAVPVVGFVPLSPSAEEPWAASEGQIEGRIH